MTESNDGESTLPALQKLAVDYAKYLTLAPVSHSEIDKINAVIKHLYNRIDEFNVLLSSQMKNETMKTEELLPLLKAKAQQIMRIFSVIDSLEYVVAKIEKSAMIMKAKVLETEQNYNDIQSNNSSVGKLLGALSFSSKPPMYTMPEWEQFPIVSHSEVAGLKQKLKDDFVS